MPKKSVNLSADAIEKVEAFEKADKRGSFSNALETIIHKQIPDKPPYTLHDVVVRNAITGEIVKNG